MVRLRRGTPFVLALAVALALLAGCSNGGTTFPGTYQCTAPQNPYGCATAIEFGHSHINPDSNPDIAGDPVYLYSDLLVVPLTCDAACQTSSGNTNPPGFIYNFVSMYDHLGGGYLEAGYETTVSSGMQYFVQFQIPGINSGQFTHIDLGAAPTGDGSNTINYKYAYIAMGHQAQQTFFGAADDWVVIIEPPYGSNFFLVEDLGKSSFHPDRVQYGQFIYGTSGATGLLAFFANNNIFATPFSAQHLQEILTEDGTPPGTIQTVDHPSDARWFFPATKSSSGGMFYVSCC
jgi:hypothetical protein